MCGVALSLGLGFYSLMVLKPAPVIDKSIEAFNIPNHISSRRQDALEEAMAEWKSRLLNFRYRKRRDISDVEDRKPGNMEFDKHDLFRDTPEGESQIMHELTSGGDTEDEIRTSRSRASLDRVNSGTSSKDYLLSDTLASLTDNSLGGLKAADVGYILNDVNKATKTQVPKRLHADILSHRASGTIEVYNGMNKHHQPQLKQVPVEEFRRRLSIILDRDWQDAAAEEQELWEKYNKDTNSNSNCTKLKFSSSKKYHRYKRDVDAAEMRRIYGRTQVIRRWKMMLVYLAQGDDDPNVFTEETLETIKEVEDAVKRHPDYTNFCHIDYDKWESDENLDLYNGCAPLNSLLTYFYPSTTVDGKIHYDGLGTDLADINRTLAFAMTKESFFWFVDDRINSNNRRSRLLRTEVHFGVPLPG